MGMRKKMIYQVTANPFNIHYNQTKEAETVRHDKGDNRGKDEKIDELDIVKHKRNVENTDNQKNEKK